MAADPPQAVEVRTGARLHFGLLTHGRGPGRLGGIGLMIDRPGVSLHMTRADADRIDAPPDLLIRVAEIVRRFREQALTPDFAGGFDVRLTQTIPPHRGFGSGTQLERAVVSGLMRLALETDGVRSDFPPPSDRGRRSSVGSRGFVVGGFIADWGPLSAEVFGPPVTFEVSGEPSILGAFGEHPVPEAWRFVLIDPAGPGAVSGPAEAAAFAALPPMPGETTERLCALVRDAIRPGLEAAEFEAFAAGVAEFNRVVGGYFAPVQRGVYAHPLVRRAAELLAMTAWPHLAKSSWGPAAAVLCENEESAAGCSAFLKRRFGTDKATVVVARPLNAGASIEFQAR